MKIFFLDFPIPIIDDNTSEMTVLKTEIIDSVKKLLALHQEESTEVIRREISFYKSKVDKEVYKIYGLKKEDHRAY